MPFNNRIRPDSGMTPLNQSPRQHDRVAQTLRGLVKKSLKPGDPLPPVRELMARLNVSMGTVRAAQALLQQEGLIEIRHGAGAYVSLEEKRLRIGVLSDLDLLHPRTGHFFRALASGVMERFRERGAHPTLYTGSYVSPLEPPAEPVCPQFWEDIEAGRLDGAVIVDAWLNDDYFERCRRSPAPLVGSFTGYVVSADTPAIVDIAVRRLAKAGCTRLALMTWEHRLAAEPFRKAVAECGRATKDAWIKSDISPNLAGAGWDEFREIWAASCEKPDGLVILDDLLFTDAQLAIFELGIRVPEQLRLAIQTNCGSDAQVRLPVTAAFEIDPDEAAEFLADTLMERLRGELLPPTTHTLGFRERVSPESPTPVDGNRLAPTGVGSSRLASAAIGGSRKAEEE